MSYNARTITAVLVKTHFALHSAQHWLLTGKHGSVLNVLNWLTNCRRDRTLTRLEMSKCNIKAEGCAAVANALRHAAITQLNLADNTLCHDGSGRISMSGITTLGYVLSASALAQLDISGNALGGRVTNSISAVEVAITAIGASAKANPTLSVLNLSNNKLTAKDTAGFIEHLRSSHGLSQLDISNNKIAIKRKTEIERICKEKTITCVL
jgi:Ran GTPase-activating protein (RanGAP) involved in mRNA processing and transport